MKAQGWVKYRIGETRLLVLMMICGLFLNLSVALILVSNYFLHPFEKENRSECTKTPKILIGMLCVKRFKILKFSYIFLTSN